ncbi:hypothetical protein TRIP_C90194 [Candidatus Zixiibacteriota bacterium]|nr:hypothetical protein TRIP_C90194 [candidate division Zixibacteria bacterium]
MKNIRFLCGGERGISMVEMLIALFMTALVLSAIFGVYINQHKNWMIQEDVTDIQQNSRAAIDELTRQIRMAGNGLPLGLPGIVASNTNPDTITINYSSTGCQAPIEHAMPTPSSELRCDGHDVSCFHDSQYVYIFSPDSGGGEFLEITEVQAAAFHLQHNTTILSRCYPQGSIVLQMEQLKYYIDRTDTAHPNLMLKVPGKAAQVYAENIEDLQFQYTMKNGATVNLPAIVDDIRAVKISLIGRSSRTDPSFANQYRRRTFNSVVNLRNFAMD